MFLTFKKHILPQKDKFRGFRLHKDDNGEFFLTKNNEFYHEEEFVFYLNWTEIDITIKSCYKTKYDGRRVPVKTDHKYYKKAELICDIVQRNL
jgi:hypothetical protein